MFKIEQVNIEIKNIIQGLKDNALIDLIECEEYGPHHFEVKFSIELRAFDFLKKWFESHIFINILATGGQIPVYATGPITNKKGWGVIHIKCISNKKF